MTTTTTAIQRGWARPTGAIRKLLQSDTWNNRVVAYIYADGILVKQDTEAKVGKTSIKVEIWHAWSCRTGLVSGRLVLHNASLLLDGLDRVEVYYDNSSQKSKELKIPVDTVMLHTAGGMTIRQHCLNFISGDITVQPDGEGDFEKSRQYLRQGETLIDHTEA